MNSRRTSTVGAITEPAWASRKIAFDGGVPGEGGATAGMHRARGHADRGLPGSGLHLQDAEHGERPGVLERAHALVDPVREAVGVDLHLGQRLAQRGKRLAERGIAQVLELAVLQMGDGRRHHGPADSEGDGGAGQVEPGQDDVELGGEATALLGEPAVVAHLRPPRGSWETMRSRAAPCRPTARRRAFRSRTVGTRYSVESVGPFASGESVVTT